MAQITVTYQENQKTTPSQILKEFALANVTIVGLVCAAFLAASLPNTDTSTSRAQTISSTVNNPYAQ